MDMPTVADTAAASLHGSSATQDRLSDHQMVEDTIDSRPTTTTTTDAATAVGTQPITLSVGDILVRLFPRYQRRRRRRRPQQVDLGQFVDSAQVIPISSPVDDRVSDKWHHARCELETSPKPPSTGASRRLKRLNNNAHRAVQQRLSETNLTFGDEFNDVTIERRKKFSSKLFAQQSLSPLFPDKIARNGEASLSCCNDDAAMDNARSYRLAPAAAFSTQLPVRARFFGDDIEKERIDNVSLESAMDACFPRYDDDVMDDESSIYTDGESAERLQACLVSAETGYRVRLSESEAAQTPLITRKGKRRSKSKYFDDGDESETDMDPGEGRVRGRRSKTTISSENRRHLTFRRRLNSFNNRLMLLTGVGRRTRCNCSAWFKKIVGFLASTVGLTFLLICYTVFGGWLFRCLEIQTVMHEKENMRKVRDRYVEQLWNVTERLNVLFHENWTSLASEILDSFSGEVFKATKRRGWNGPSDLYRDDNLDADYSGGGNVEDDEGQWSYAGAMLYSITVITTIGYGHITPKTTAGRLATIAYAIVGIPLTLLTITHLGVFMATLFRFIYKNISDICHQAVCMLAARLRRVRCPTWRPPTWRRSDREQSRLDSQPITVDADDRHVDHGSAPCSPTVPSLMPPQRNQVINDVIHVTVSTTTATDTTVTEYQLATTTKESHSNRQTGSYSHDAGADGFDVGLCPQLSVSKSDVDNNSVRNGDVICDVSEDAVKGETASHDVKEAEDLCLVVSGGNLTVENDRSDLRFESSPTRSAATSHRRLAIAAGWAARMRTRLELAFANIDDVRVPAWVSLLLIVGYIAFGAVVFSVWERVGDEPDNEESGEGEDDSEWSFVIGCYFCFITLSTIGFGDFVPGTSHSTPDARQKLVLCAMYLLIGLALIAMCFQLIQEEVRRTVVSIGVRLGLISDDETEDQEINYETSPVEACYYQPKVQ